MLTVTRNAARWVGRHAFPAVAATAIAIGAAGGGIGYAVASHNTAATVASTSGASAKTPSSTAAKGAARGAALIHSALNLVAKGTGQTVATVRSQLEAGKSIDQIAGAKAATIESSILAEVTKLADRAVTAGRITAAQEATGLAAAKTKIEALMAEPGTQLIKEARSALQFLHTHGGKHGATASPAPPSPAA